ncbi:MULTISPECIES: glycoside hydrolase family 3 C-terminal domain-containing protein [unclassified Paraflavitalea]|uniref:glycoside hydrolase family 3 C-terminal domain-containing protein n=1 Tax=unclassified Paraflavitalea TaxID=2798305 RepID=UPI003D338AD7
MKRLFFSLLSLAAVYSTSAQQPAYKDPKLPIPVRVEDLLSRMTPREKFFQLFMIPGEIDSTKPDQYKDGLFGFQVSAGGGSDAGGQLLSYNTKETALALANKINKQQKYFVEKTRLGIPLLPFDEGLHGLVRQGATSFPQSIGLAASFDTALVSAIGAAIAIQSKERGIRQILSPVINIASDVRWGRVEETYGEDPYLTSRMGVAYMKSFETRGVITTPKHLLANVGDGGRDSYPIYWNDRFLQEIHLPPFKAAFEEAGTRSVMTSYNSVNGTPMSSNYDLLTRIVKKQWGFGGFIISDASAVGGALVLHKTAKDYPESGKQAIEGGLDVIFQTEFKHHELFDPHFLDGSMDTARINDAVRRVLTAKFQLGLFENPYVSVDPAAFSDLNKARELAREAARKSTVLLKNARDVLPIANNTQKIVVIGEEAKAARLGGYSGPGVNPISIYDGLKAGIDKSQELFYARGVGLKTDSFEVIPSKFLTTADGKQGLNASYYSGIQITGKPTTARIDGTINFNWTLFPPDASLTPDFYAAEWNGFIEGPGGNEYRIGLEGNEGFRMYIDGKLVIDAWDKRTYRSHIINYTFKKGRKYALKIQFYETIGTNATIKLIWNAGIKDNLNQRIKEAVMLTNSSDVAIVVAGIHEGEFQDRAFLSLPGNQEAIIKAVAATGKPVIVVLIGGSAITMNNWMDDVEGILMGWYPGEAGGDAIADILLGKYNPGGKLPITFPIHESQLPLVYNHAPTGRGDNYYNLSGLPLFPFGYGLSYTTFSYTDIKLSKPSIKATDSCYVTATITNTGSREGDEVVQLYIHNELASVVRPVLELKGFQRVRLAKGESKHVSFKLSPKEWAYLNQQMKWVTEKGDYRIILGSSSQDLRLKTTLKIE